MKKTPANKEKPKTPQPITNTDEGGNHIRGREESSAKVAGEKQKRAGCNTGPGATLAECIISQHEDGKDQPSKQQSAPAGRMRDEKEY
jgi:hypothetical protein